MDESIDVELPLPSFFDSSNSSSSSSGGGGNGRVIAHIDLDCFYVQVECSHNPSLRGKPVAVVQYNPFGKLKSLDVSANRFVDNGSIIAVSYEARAQGVKRIMRGAEARVACPEISLVQVPTSHGKADLTIYRQASALIVQMLGKRYPSVVIERASIDEVYLDVTEQARILLADAQGKNSLDALQQGLQDLPLLLAGQDENEVRMHKHALRDGHTAQGETREQTVDTWLTRPLHVWSVNDLLLLCGAEIVRQLREDVRTQLGFTTSAGIASNKMLAKLGSGMHKPSKQTVVPQHVVARLVAQLPYSRVQGFGGKLGGYIQERFGDRVTTLGDLSSLPKAELVAAFGDETARWILAKATGEDQEPVQQRALPISIGCSKSFHSTNILLPKHLADGTVQHWLENLAEELVERMDWDQEHHHRLAKQFCVAFSMRPLSTDAAPVASSGGGSDSAPGAPPSTASRWWHSSRSISLSKHARLPPRPTAAVLGALAHSLVMRVLGENARAQEMARVPWGISDLGVSVSQFDHIEHGKGSITNFLRAPGPSSDVSDPSPPPPLPQSSDDGVQQSAQQSVHTGAEGPRSTAATEPAQSGGAAPIQLNRHLKMQGVDAQTFSELPAEIQQELLASSYFQAFSSRREAGEPAAKRPKTAGQDLRRWMSKSAPSE